MMLSAVAIAVLLGWILGGSINDLVELPFARVEVLTAAFGIQLFMHFAAGQVPSGITVWAFGLHLLSYGLIFYVMWHNRNLPGMPLIAAGVLLNLLVIIANGGMPVSPQALMATGQGHLVDILESGGSMRHQLMDSQTALSFLGDHLTTPDWFWSPTVYSPGDLVMIAGLFWLVPAAMRGNYGGLLKNSRFSEEK